MQAAPASLLLLYAMLAAAPHTELIRYEKSQRHMGTLFEIVLYAENEEQAEAAFDVSFSRIAALDNAMSDYDPDSELSQLSRSSPTAEPVRVSAELLEVLSYSQKLSAESKGAFDVTVGPLTKLWRRARRRKQMPSPARLAEARAAVGFGHMKVVSGTGTVELLRENMRLDLGGIAKGYAGDQALAALAASGVPRALVNAGGDIVVGEAPPGKPGWRIGVASLKPAAPPSRFVYLTRAAIATSGDAWQYVEIDGARYSHILDPHTGLGLTSRSSVTIVAPTGMQADSFASAVSVLGVEEGLRFVKAAPKVGAIVVFVESGKVRQRESERFRTLAPAIP